MGLQHLLVVVLIPTCTSLSLQHVNEEWSLFKLKFNRSFTSTEEENYRFSVFVKNLKTIILHNTAADNGHSSYWMGINNFADLTDKEFEEQYTGLKIKPRTKTVDDNLIKQGRVNLTALPKEVDWRNNDCVTRVKFQGLCGSCYAFAATGALEGHTCIKTKKLVSLSEQNIIDCTDNKLYANEGCIGGQAENAYIYVEENGGIDTEKSYPYDQKVGDCKYSKENIGATAKGLKELPIGNEFALQKAVAWNGPVSVCIDSTGTKSYSHGIYDGKDETHLSTCSSEKVNHAMLVIGYGTSTNGQDYWLLKNSWGTTWGLEGYMKLVRNKRNRCGITTIASYPIV